MIARQYNAANSPKTDANTKHFFVRAANSRLYNILAVLYDKVEFEP